MKLKFYLFTAIHYKCKLMIWIDKCVHVGYFTFIKCTRSSPQPVCGSSPYALISHKTQPKNPPTNPSHIPNQPLSSTPHPPTSHLSQSKINNHPDPISTQPITTPTFPRPQPQISQPLSLASKYPINPKPIPYQK